MMHGPMSVKFIDANTYVSVMSAHTLVFSWLTQKLVN